MTVPRTAPPMSYFEPSRPAAGDRVLTVELGSLQIELGSLDPALAEVLLTRYTPYGAMEPASSSDALRVRVALDDRDYYIDPPEAPVANPVVLTIEGDRVRYVGYRVAGWFDTAGGSGVMLLARGGLETPDRAIENYVRAAVAWQAATRGGALVHAASAVRKDRAYLFYGESGAGKSTLSEANCRGRVVSDDLSLVLPSPDGSPELVGSPFRGTYEGGAPVVGRFPLVAGFRIIKDDHAEVRPVPRIRALSELVGNLPFVAEAFGLRPDLFEAVQRAFAGVELAHLHFRKDDSYWDAIEKAGL
jgi:hypothetical protein